MNNQEQRHSIKKIIEAHMEGWTVERVLRQGLSVSRSLLRSAKRRGDITLNGESVKSNVQVKPGDILELAMEKQESSVIPQRMDLNIIYEDQDLLAVNKPPDMLVHPLTTQPTGTLANGVLYHWLQHGIVNLFRPVHRLDRDTSGLVLIARNAYAHQQLQLQMKKGLLTRRYVAVVSGQLQKNKGIIRAPIGLEEGSIIRRTINPSGKPAVSHYRVLRQMTGGSLISVELETGRTHQVRVHMAYLGHPLFGDSLYGGECTKIKRQALHCAYLALKHPVSGVMVKLVCPIPADMKKLISDLD